MYKTECITGEWCVVSDKLPKGKVVCIIPHWYKEDEQLANTIAELLNKNDKIIINLSV